MFNKIIFAFLLFFIQIDFGNFVEKYTGEEYSIPYTRPIVKGIVEVSFYSDSVFTFKGYQMAFKYNKSNFISFFMIMFLCYTTFFLI